MLGGRFKNAMSDVAETIRRAFQDPPTRFVDMGLGTPRAHGMVHPVAQGIAPSIQLEPALASVPMLDTATLQDVDFHWEGQLRQEEGWARWAAGAQVVALPLFKVETCARLEVPPLPRKPKVGVVPPEAFRTRSRAGLEPVPVPRAGSQALVLQAPRIHRALELVLSLPVGFTGMDLAKISKALWMRYTLKLVRETGENIRNLEVLGVYRIPTRGTRQVNHQAATGRLLVVLGPESLGAPRAPFILARKKDDDSVVCCFVEDV